MKNNDWRERFEKLVVGRGTSDGRIPPITMGEVLLNTPNPEGRKILEDFISKEIEKARKEGYTEGASNAIVTDIKGEIEKAEERGYETGKQSFVAEISISENMEKIERFFREAPIDYDDKCNSWFQFLEDLTLKEDK